jgi:phage-related protein
LCSRLLHNLPRTIPLALDTLAELCQNWHTMSTDDTNPQKPLFWMGSSHKDLKAFPSGVRQTAGFALWQAQQGRKHVSAKVLKGFGGAGVLEVIEDDDGSTYRVVYTVKFAGSVYVLHAFQKKSKSGIKTPTAEIETVRRRLKAAEEHHAARLAEEGEREN